MKKYKGIIFDFNGVLLIDQYLHDEVFQKIASEIRGKEFTEEELLHSVYGRNNKLIFEYLLDRPLGPKELESLSADKELKYQALSKMQGDKYQLSFGAVELLGEIKRRNIPHTIATSSPAMNVAFYNQMLHLDRWFDMSTVICDGGTWRGKPAPDIYIMAARALSLDPTDCVVIEDARSGIVAAHNAGIGYIIAIGPKNTHIALRALDGVNETIETLAELNLDALFE